MWWLLPALWSAPALASLPLATAPVGAAWLAPWIAPGPARLAQVGVLLGAAIGFFGFYARLGFALVTVCGLYLMAIPQFFGGVQHYHHLLWLSALLAVSPASDALALGQWRPVPGRSLGWGLPTRVAWALLACVYFFPGLHKLWAQGFGWAGENLTTLMYWKWAQSWDFEPLTRLDHTPSLLAAGGVAVLLFEVGAPLLLYNRWTRLCFVLVATAFHVGTALWFNIHFWGLLVCFAVLLPFPEPTQAQVERPVRPAAVVGALLLSGVVASGLTATTQGWPFACYPTFEREVPRWMPTLVLVGLDADGAEHPVPERALADAAHSQAFYSEAWGVSGLYGPINAEALDAFARRALLRPAVRAALGPSSRVRVVLAQRSVDPDAPELTRGEVLLEVEVAPRR